MIEGKLKKKNTEEHSESIESSDSCRVYQKNVCRKSLSLIIELSSKQNFC